MNCINCGSDSNNETRLCLSCREESPFPVEQLDMFIGVLETFEPKEDTE